LLWRTVITLARIVLGLVAVLLVATAGWLAYSRIRIATTETMAREQAAPAGGRWVRAHDVNIHLREWGPVDGRPLLLVHGTGAWNGTWVSNVDALAAAGFHVVAMDLPPFGFSSLPANGDYSRLTQARRIQAVIAGLRAPGVTLLGHSFGGGPATEAAMLDRASISHLVLVDAAIGLQAGAAQAPCAISLPSRLLLGWRPLRTSVIAAVATEPAFGAYWLRQFVARKEAVTPQRTAIYQQPFAGQDYSAGLGDWAWQFIAGCETPKSTQPGNFRQLEVPVSLVWGAEDSITPLAQARQLNGLLPRSRLTVLKGVGHIPQIEDVAAFNAEIVKVLQAAP
jgi:pimeloyl-ACP methyl ester carboxylesterase